MPLSTTAENAAGYDVYVESMSSFAADEEERARALTEVDPGFALGHAIWAFTAAFNGTEGVDIDAEVAAARSGRADHDWERSLLGVFTTVVSEGMWEAYPDLLRHCDEYRGDVVGYELSAFLQSTSTEPDRMVDIGRRSQAVLEAIGPNPHSYSGLAFVAEEAGSYDEALAWNDRLFELRPDHILGAHVMAHVNFERGDHADGLAWLEGWYERGDRTSPYFGHLRWHAGLHELAEGDEQAALVTLHELGANADSFTVLADLGGLGLRCQQSGLADPAALPIADAVAELLDGAASAPPRMAGRGMFVALALTARGDAEALRRYANLSLDATAPGAAELVPGLATALADYVEGSWTSAADGLLALEGRFERYGGSHAQRELLTDTLIESLVRAGRPAEAITRIDARLARRDSRIDRARRTRALSLPGPHP